MKRLLLLIAAFGLLAGCASTNDAYYSALKADLEARSRVEVAKFEADRARLTAIAQIAATGGDSAKTAAVLALALHAGAGTVSPQPPASVPAPPRSGWESAWVMALQVVDVGLRAWGIKVGGDVAIRQSDNAANQAIASYNAFTQTATAGFNSNAAIAGFIQAPQPNITLSGTGALATGGGAATYNWTGPVTRTCTGGAGAPGGDAGGTTGGPGGSGAPGGPASC